MKTTSSSFKKDNSTPGDFYESINGSLRSPTSAVASTKRKGSNGYEQISSVRTQLSLEKKKVQDLNKCVQDYHSLKQKSDQKASSSTKDMHFYQQEVERCQKEIQNYQYKVQYLEREKGRLENQNKQLKSYIGKLEFQLKSFVQRKASGNSPINRTTNSAGNLNQTFPNNENALNSSNIQNQQNSSQGGGQSFQQHQRSGNNFHVNSSQNLNASAISQGQNQSQVQAYVKKLEADAKNYQEEIKLLNKVIDVNAPKVSIKRGINESNEDLHEKSVSHLARELTECREVMQRNESLESDLREKIHSLNKELERALIQIEEERVLRESDQDEILRLEKELNIQRQNPSSSRQHQSFYSKKIEGESDQLVLKETIRELTEEISEVKGKMTEQNLQAYSDNTKWTKQVEQLRDQISSKDEELKQSLLKFKEIQLELESLKEKNQKLGEKKVKQKQEIEQLKIEGKQLEGINSKISQKLTVQTEQLHVFQSNLSRILKISEQNINQEVILDEISFAIEEAVQLRQAVEEALNKYAQQALINNDIKQQLLRREQQIERQAEYKTAIQSTLSSQIYNLRCQNTDLEDANSTIRRECTAFIENLKSSRLKKSKKSTKKSRRSRSRSPQKH